MEITYNWTIQKMNTCLAADGFTNVVVSVNWACSAKTTIDGSDVYANTLDFCALPPPSSEFTPYNELTQQEVLDWIWPIIGKDKIEAGLLIDLQRIINPPVIVLPNPWD